MKMHTSILAACCIRMAIGFRMNDKRNYARSKNWAVKYYENCIRISSST